MSRDLAPVALVAAALLAAHSAAAAPRDQATLRGEVDELRRLIEQQQQTIQSLQQHLQQLEGQQTQSRRAVEEVDKKVEQARKAAAAQPLVQAGRKNVKLALSGYVDRMVNVGADGKHTKAYFVDNNVANSRFRLDGSYEPNSDTSVGATIEVAVRPNNSAQVSQLNESAGDNFEQRKVEVFAKSKTAGQFWLGKGDPAAKDIARLDLSGTDLIAWANVGDPAGGLLFEDDNRYTGTTVGSVFSDFDPSRQNRVRYDTPVLAGFTASGTYAENERYSGAVRWSGQGLGLKSIAGVGWSNPNASSVDHVLSGSVSLLHVGSGLSLTAAAGEQDRNDYNPYFTYVKGGWQWDLLPYGRTAFSLDWQHGEDRPTRDDSSDSFGLYAVQGLTDIGTDLFAGVRLYSLDVGGGPNPSDIYVGTVGARVRF